MERHVDVRTRQLRREAERLAREEIAEAALAALDAEEIAGLLVNPVDFAADLAAIEARFAVFRVAPPVPAGLAALGHDVQNVHTATVVTQTNTGEAKLLSIRTDGRPVGLRVLECFAARAENMQGFLQVANDVEHWYSTKTCRREGDRLYGRALEGLWTLIEQQPAPAAAELKVRLWQEASESVGMCCEGHIARLVNVMVGFDEAFRPRASTGEVIQAKMAKIAESPSADKVAEARAFLTEMGLTAEEQAPWLEALE